MTFSKLFVSMMAVLTLLVRTGMADEPVPPAEPTREMTCHALQNIRRANQEDPDALEDLGRLLAAGTLGAGLGASAAYYGKKGAKVIRAMVLKPELVKAGIYRVAARRALKKALEQTLVEAFEHAGMSGRQIETEIPEVVFSRLETIGVSSLTRRLPWLKEVSARGLLQDFEKWLTVSMRENPGTTGTWTSGKIGKLAQWAAKSMLKGEGSVARWATVFEQHAVSKGVIKGLKNGCRIKPPKAMGGALFGLGIAADVLTTTRSSAATPREAVIDEPSFLYTSYATRYGINATTEPCESTVPELRSLINGNDEGARLFRANVDTLGDASLSILYPTDEQYVRTDTHCEGSEPTVAEREAPVEKPCDDAVATCRDVGPPVTPAGGRSAQ
jgi:hypothetical protein